MESISRLVGRLKEKNLDAALVSDPNAICYFTGTRFSPGERLLALVVKRDGSFRLFVNQLFPYNGAVPIRWYSDAQDGVEILAQELTGAVAVDKSFPARFLLRLQALKPELKLILGTVIDEVKAVKTPEEQQKMIRASQVNDSVMAQVAELIQVGKSEAQLRDEIDEIFRRVSQGNSFDTIVAYGDHAADPHGVPGDRRLRAAEAVVVDMGCVVDGYCSDMTRTFFVGENPEREIYDTVLRANLAGIAAVKPGIPFREIDLAARRVIEEAGYGAYFIHRLGHGIGMEVHEPFDVSATDEVIVEEGMCFSIEPGIYIPGRVGIRIEDLVCVTKDGCRVLNAFPKNSEIL
ncbi:MAG: M24 family metallopeptidase [Faecousia sp.]